MLGLSPLVGMTIKTIVALFQGVLKVRLERVRFIQGVLAQFLLDYLRDEVQQGTVGIGAPAASVSEKYSFLTCIFEK